MNFFERLITAGSGLSSKRFLSLFAMLLYTAVVICSLCQINVPDLIHYSLVTIILGGSAMTFFQNKKGGL
jgi:hypothetical protein